MKLNTKSKTLKLYNSIKQSADDSNIVIFQFLTSDYKLDELEAIFKNRAEIQTMYKLTDNNQLIVMYNDYTNFVGIGTETISVSKDTEQTIQVEDENGVMVDTVITTPVIFNCDIYTVKMSFRDPVKDLVNRNRADIDYVALITGTDL